MKKKELEFYLHNHLFNIVNDMKKSSLYKYNWNVIKSDFDEINQKLSIASKNSSFSSIGRPDLIYFNPETKLLILGEIKNDIKKHTSNSVGKIKDPKSFLLMEFYITWNFLKNMMYLELQLRVL
ncbi:hypothetical protein [Spiroplasma citri]|uniref:hypothetical protein n=1 Tax=Spiroplasma citri TaxID=2133 RepID=UPI0013A0AAA7|nr:hypothetical protein [Spiroplasma citri]QIA68056.1 hypothetical protein GMI18_10915 [Spiroplasma citri]